jgi:hypothetical protein
MNPLLALLLGQQGAAPEATSAANMVVTGNRANAPANPQDTSYDDYVLNNTDAVTARAADVSQTEEASQRKGMFGVKGTLRDILGLVGDAFLVQGGNKPMYAPHRQQERISDAMAGFSVDPVAAGERVANYDAGLGYDIVKDARATELAQGKLKEDGRTENRQAFKDASARISQAYAAVMQNPTPETAAYALQLARNESEVLGIPLAQLGVTEDMTQDVMSILAGRGSTVSQTNNLPLAERRVANSEAVTDIARQRLGVALRMAKNQEDRTRIMEQAFGLKRDDQQFDQMMDLFGVSIDATKAANSGKKDTPRTLPNAKKLQISPVQ